MNNAKKVLVIAPTSLVGSRFVELISDEYQVFGAGFKDELTDSLPLTSFQEMDILDSESIDKVVGEFQGEYLINFAGATDVSGIEKTRPADLDNLQELESNLAYKINVVGTKNLIAASNKFGKTPIFISTDFVFNGDEGPYQEDAPICKNPEEVSFYAWTKILAEQEIEKSQINCLVIRISYPYRKEFPLKSDVVRGFLDTYDKSLKGEATLYPAFADQTFTPTLIDDLAEAFKLLENHKVFGIYNLASLQQVNFYDFFCELLKVARSVKDPKSVIKKGSIDKYFKENPMAAKWPKNGGLRSGRIIKLGFTPTNWKEGIRKIYG